MIHEFELEVRDGDGYTWQQGKKATLREDMERRYRTHINQQQRWRLGGEHPQSISPPETTLLVLANLTCARTAVCSVFSAPVSSSGNFTKCGLPLFPYTCRSVAPGSGINLQRLQLIYTIYNITSTFPVSCHTPSWHFPQRSRQLPPAQCPAQPTTLLRVHTNLQRQIWRLSVGMAKCQR